MPSQLSANGQSGRCFWVRSRHAKRLARWILWLDETLLAPVPHRQVVLTIPKRLRPYCLYRRALLGDLARLAARIVTAGVRATTGEPDWRGQLRTRTSRDPLFP